MDLHRYRRQLVINWAFFREKKKEIGVKVTLRIYSTSFLGKFTGGFFLWNCRFHVFITLPNWKYPCTKLITPDHGLLCTQWQTSPWIQHSSLSLNSRITWEVCFVFIWWTVTHSYLPYKALLFLKAVNFWSCCLSRYHPMTKPVGTNMCAQYWRAKAAKFTMVPT